MRTFEWILIAYGVGGLISAVLFLRGRLNAYDQIDMADLLFAVFIPLGWPGYWFVELLEKNDGVIYRRRKT